MNSDREARLFREFGWERDAVLFKWTAPDGYEITDSDLIAAVQVMGPAMERRLLEIVMEHGKRG